MRMRYIGVTLAAASAVVLGSTAPAMAGEAKGGDTCQAMSESAAGLIALNVPILSPSFTEQNCNNTYINIEHGKKHHHHHMPTLG